MRLLADERALEGVEVVLTLNPDPPFGLLAHVAHCPYLEGRMSMPLSTPALDPEVFRHECLLDEHGRLSV